MGIAGRKLKKSLSIGHDFDRIEEKVYGGRRGWVNKQKELFSSDYIWTAPAFDEPDDDDFMDAVDVEVGINKNRYIIHEPDYNNEYKNEMFDTGQKTFEEILLDANYDVDSFFIGGDDE